MNFNHLMGNDVAKRRCSAGCTECYWRPVGNIRATHGENVHLTMYCKHCARREDIFLSQKDYHMQEKLILKELRSV
jgi:hypothetical protein